MTDRLLCACDYLATFHLEESGEDLVEYAMVAVLIALAAAVGMGAVASQINAAFVAVAKKFKSAGL